MIKLIIIFCFILVNMCATQETVFITFYNMNSGERIEEVVVFDSNDNFLNISDKHGQTHISMDFKDSIFLKIEHIAYEDTSFFINAHNSKQYFYLKEKIYTDTIEVVSNYFNPIKASYIRIEDIKFQSKFLGELDLIKSLHLEAGVNQSMELKSAYHVRGGLSQHNAIYIDQVKLYNYQHFFGISSAFNTLSVKSMSFYKSIFPSEISNHLSSVLQLHLKDGNQYKWGGEANISLLSTQIEVDGPSSLLNGTIMVAARRTYFDWFSEIVTEFGQIINEVPEDASKKNDILGNLYFTDFTFKLNSQISNNLQIYYMFFIANDFFTIKNGDLSNNWQNLATSFSSFYFFNSKLQWKNSLSWSQYHYYLFYDVNNDDRERAQAIYGFSFSSNLFFQWNSAIKQISGILIDKERLKFKDRIQDKFNNQSDDIWNYTLYTDIDFLLKKNIYLQANIPLNIYINNESSTLFSPKIKLLFGSKENQISFSIYYNQQFLHYISPSEQDDPTRIIQFSEADDLTHEKMLGYSMSYQLNTENWFILSEIYQQEFKNIPLMIRNDRLIESSNITQSRLRSYGFDLQLKYKFKSVKSYINYSYSYSRLYSKNLNYGKSYEPGYNRPHKLNFIIEYQTSESWRFHSAAYFSSGQLISVPNYAYFVENQYYNFFNDKNNYRHKFNRRVDLSFTYFFETFYAKWEMNISIYNVFFSENPIYITYIDNQVKSASLGILPNIGFNIIF